MEIWLVVWRGLLRIVGLKRRSSQIEHPPKGGGSEKKPCFMGSLGLMIAPMVNYFMYCEKK